LTLHIAVDRQGHSTVLSKNVSQRSSSLEPAPFVIVKTQKSSTSERHVIEPLDFIVDP
jgi:hypothetical protein